MMTDRQRLAVMWLIVAVVFFIGIWLCRGERHKQRWPMQGAGAADLIAPVEEPPRALPGLPELVTPPIFGTLHYFVATATDTSGLESDFSNEVFFFRTNRGPKFITLAWDVSTNDPGTYRYRVYRGRESHAYDTTFDAGSNLILTVPLFPPPKTNIIIRVSASNAIGISFTDDTGSNWVGIPQTTWTATNPPGIRLFRAIGTKKNSGVTITSEWE